MEIVRISLSRAYFNVHNQSLVSVAWFNATKFNEYNNNMF